MTDSVSSHSEQLELDHHKQQELCTTRPAYRQGRKLTAVKVYTINDESRHLLIFNVPKLNLRNELKNLCSKYGKVMLLHNIEYKSGQFTECFHCVYEEIKSARVAKRMLDTRAFYGEILHVCYGPELEAWTETRDKLNSRKSDVAFRIAKNQKDREKYERERMREINKKIMS